MFKVTMYFRQIEAKFFISHKLPVLANGYIIVYLSDRDMYFPIEDLVSFTVQTFGV